MEANEYDIVVIDSGSDGQKGAVCAAKIHSGTIIRLHGELCLPGGFRQRNFYGRSYALKDRIAMSDLIFRAQADVARD